MRINGWKPASGWSPSKPDSPPPNTLHQCKESVMHFWTGKTHAAPTSQGWQWPWKAMVKQAFGSPMDTEISSFLSHIACDTVLFALKLVLYQVMGLQGSDKVTTSLSRANAWHILWIQPLQLHRTMHKPELVSVLQTNICICSRASRSICESTIQHWKHRRWSCKDAELLRWDL